MFVYSSVVKAQGRVTLGQGWAINSYQGPHESPELCQRATNFLLLRAEIAFYLGDCIKPCPTLREALDWVQ